MVMVLALSATDGFTSNCNSLYGTITVYCVHLVSNGGDRLPDDRTMFESEASLDDNRVALIQ